MSLNERGDVVNKEFSILEILSFCQQQYEDRMFTDAWQHCGGPLIGRKEQM